MVSTRGKLDEISAPAHSTVLVLNKQAVLRRTNSQEMDAMKCIIIVAMCIFLSDLNVAAATSATTLMRPSRGKMSNDHQSGSMRVELLDGEEDAGARLEELRPNIGQDEDEEPSQLMKLAASNSRRAERYKETDQVHRVRKRKAIPAKSDLEQPISGRRSGRYSPAAAGPPGELFAAKDLQEHRLNDLAALQGDSITTQELKAKSPATKSTLIKNGYVEHESKLIEADNIKILQRPTEDESLMDVDTRSAGGAEYTDIYDDAGQRKMKRKKLSKKKPHLQVYPEDGKEVAEALFAHGEAKSDSQNVSAKGKLQEEAARMNIDGESDILVISSREEVVIAEESNDDKQLIPEYNLGEPIENWDLKRQEWRREHPEVKQEQLFILTGTQPWPCTNPEGDHLLLRCFKNKVDYSRIHGVGLFYNTALLDAQMPTFWAKLPVVRATMLAHPEVEWIWWLDADAIITDMEFSIPLHRYTAYNLVVHGWESLIFEKRSWLGLNAGSFLLRNCQWSLELLERWACMGPKAPMGDAYRHILSDFLPDRPRNPTDDQAALVYLLIKEPQRWAGKLRVELDFFLSGYWLELMDGFEATEERYRAMEEQHVELLALLEMQGAVGKEKLVAAVGRAREQHLSDSATKVQERRPFITHFTGCQPCSGNHNNIYSKEQCHHGLLRALNYGDDQVLRTLGYQHRALHLPDVLSTATATA